MRLFARHLDTAALGVTILVEAPPQVSAHLASCAHCRRRRDALAGQLEALRAAADAAADAAFSPADLQRQRQAVLHRIAKMGPVARVLRFPHSPDRSLPPARPDLRWVAGAAAAGLLLGVAAGQVPHLLQSSGAPLQDVQAVTRTAALAVPGPEIDRRLDDTLLSEVDAALASPTRPELEALDALTPVHYETR